MQLWDKNIVSLRMKMKMNTKKTASSLYTKNNYKTTEMFLE